jgi:hypothetical protein
MKQNDTEDCEVSTLVERKSLHGESLRTKNGDGRKWILKKRRKKSGKKRKKMSVRKRGGKGGEV